MEQTTARLRKTFRYPTDNDSEDVSYEAMDEEEQDSLIHAMQEENLKRNKQYNTALFSIALVAAIPYIPTLFTPRTTLLSLLSISSLLSTAYLIHTSPPDKTSIPFLDNLNTPSSPQSAASRREAMLQANDGPMKQFLPYLNMGLCVILLGLGSMASRKGLDLWWGFAWLPLGVYGVAVVAKWVMGSVDPEVELERLRYELKGA